MSLNARLSAQAARDYRELLEHLSAMVLQFVRAGNVPGVRRWASSLAHVGNVVLDDREGGRRQKTGDRIPTSDSSILTPGVR